MNVRSKPFETEAVQWSGSNWHEMLAFVVWQGGKAHTTGEVLVVETIEGDKDVHPGEWVVRSKSGDYFPLGSDVFDANYEVIE